MNVELNIEEKNEIKDRKKEINNKLFKEKKELYEKKIC
jgi:hypothetical protein